MEGGKKCPSTEDGKYVINNGLHVIQALKNVEAALEDEDLQDPPEWLNVELVELFCKGLLVDLYEYSAPDRTARFAVQVLAHEADQNKYRPATLKNKVDLVSRLFRSSKDWSAVTKNLLEVLGMSKRSTVQRWVALARDLDSDVLAYIQAKQPGMAQDYVINNKYLMGRGESTRFRLSANFAKVAINWLLNEFDKSITVNSQTFVSEFCLPAKTLELWERGTVKQYGVTAQNFKPFQRIVSTLGTSGRQRILACIRDRLPLGGKAGTPAGIEECRAVIAELSKMKAGTDPSKPKESEGPVASQGRDTPTEGEGPDSQDAGEDGADYGDLLLTGTAAAAKEDPVQKQLDMLVEKHLIHVALHSDSKSFLADCSSRICTVNKAIILLEAPTSKARILHEFVKIAAELPKKASVYIPVGSRLDILSSMMTVVKRTWPGRAAFTVSTSGEQQSMRSRSTFAIYLPAESYAQRVPTILSTTGCRAKVAEGIRLRCKDAKCPCRPAVPDQNCEEAEVPEDDIPSDGEGDFEEMGEEEDGDEEFNAQTEDAVEPTAKLLQNMFPFAFPVALHSRTLSALKADCMSHLFLLTRSAHPGMWVAAREAGLEVVALVQGSYSEVVATVALLRPVRDMPGRDWTER